MEPSRLFSGRKELRRDGRLHFAQVTLRAEPIHGESQVVPSEEVLSQLREVFGEDFEHHRHCVLSAVAAQMATIDVAGDFPQAGATSFRVDVVDVRVSGDAGREVSGFLLSVAGMDALGSYLCAWEEEHSPRPETEADVSEESHEEIVVCKMDEPEALGLGDAHPSFSEEDLRTARYHTAFVLFRNYLNDGWTEGEIRGFSELVELNAGEYSDAIREAAGDVLNGLPMRYESRFGAAPREIDDPSDA